MSDKTSIENIYNKLDEKIKAMLKKEGIVKFTEIQKLSFEKIYNGSNVLLISPTGSGKTIAAMLPIYQKWLNEKPNPISILYITPMKSLNRDLLLHLESWATV
jgi:ATP-dependent Lhr-like helicase